MKPNIIILTNSFPNAPLTSESWLADEISYTHKNFDKVIIVPEKYSNTHIAIPENCHVNINILNSKFELNFKEKINCFKIVFSDFSQYSNKYVFFKSFRYNLSLIKNLHLKAKNIHLNYNGDSSTTILYAYWADNLATTACILKQMYGSYKVIARGHGFEIFEDQTKYNVIPFRKYQYQYLTKLYTVSQTGLIHLALNENAPKTVISYSYLGTKNFGIANFEANKEFTIVTCSYIRDVKRLHLLTDILKYIKFKLTWHILGDGPDLNKLKELNKELPENISVIYHGYLKNDAILNFYKCYSINLFVSLSRSEGLPVTMMEALSFGIPIMSTDVGGCREICNEKTGLLIEKNFDPKIIANKISDFYKSSKNSLEFRLGCRNFWKDNFYAEKNYMDFSKKILSI